MKKLTKYQYSPYAFIQGETLFSFTYRHKEYKQTIDVGINLFGLCVGILIDYSN